MRRRLFRFPIRTRDEARADADAELESFVAERAADLVRRGADPEAAHDEALRRLGGPTIDDVRRRLHRSAADREERMRLRDAMHRLRQDLRFAGRQLLRAPAFTIVAAVTLALGVGASTAIFSAVNPILLEPLPYPEPRRLVTVWDVGADGTRVDATFGTYRELLARSRAFEALAAVRPWQPTLTGPTEPERLGGQRVTASYFRTLGVRPALGRDFADADDAPGAPRVAILADALWRRRFGADPAILGRDVTLDGDRYTVIGVMPASLETVLAPDAVAWSPLRYDPALPVDGREWGHHLRLIGRLRPNVDVSVAERELGAIARRPVAAFPRVRWAALDRGLTVHALRDDVTRGVRPALLAVLGAVTLLLTIACVNVTSLLLARGAARRGEMATRAAIGAGRGRIVRQLLTESLLLAALGGALGVVLAALGVRALAALAPAGLPRAAEIQLDGAALAFAVGVTTLTGLVVGLVPALHAFRGDVAHALHGSSRRTAGGHQSARRALVVAEVALALVLLVGAGLLLRSVHALFAIDPGFASAGVVTMQVQTAGARVADDAATRRFFAGALEAARDVPGVAAAAFTSQLPLSGDADEYGVRFESVPNDDSAEDDRSASRYAVTPDYFAAMRIPLRRGRLLDARDVASAPPAVLINESFARRVFGARDPVGERLRIGGEDGPWMTVVGVVGDVRQLSLAAGPADAVYVTPAQWRFADRTMSLVVRARAGADAASLVPALRAAVWSIDRDQPVVRVATMDAVVVASSAERRFVLALFEAFALASIVLAAVGLYGVLAGSVAERARELGVRAALGASRANVVAGVLRQGASLAASGVALGLAAAAAASGAIGTLLFGVSPLDPATYAGVSVLLLGVAVAACAVPAWRASRVDPNVALRSE